MNKEKIPLNFLFLLVFTFFYFFFPKPIFAQWEKYPGNPILTGNGKEWDGNNISNPYVIFDQNENIYKMWYGGSIGSIAKIGYATSNNGIDAWIKEESSIIEPSPVDNWDEKEVGHISVIYSFDNPPNKKYEAWYIAISTRWNGNYDTARVRYAYSGDGKNWTLYPHYILKGGEETQDWDSGGINRGISVVKVNGIYKMWYTGLDNQGRWQIGLAISNDGVTWEKYQNNPVVNKNNTWENYSLSYPFVMFYNNLYHMWYVSADRNRTGNKILYAYSTDGINWIKPSEINPILEKGISGEFDSEEIINPSVVKEGNTLKMWYSGLGKLSNWSSLRWSIGYAEGTLPTPTPTPTPSPSPTPTPLPPLIFLPGLGGSWNFENLFLGIEKHYSKWELTPGPGEKVYNGFIQTLKNAGYQDSGSQQNLFVFAYNWTKKVSQIADDLKDFIQKTVQPQSDQKITLVGHSLGGLVARTYVQTNFPNSVDKLLTLGSPHQGVIQSYYAWEGGDLRFMDILSRIAWGLFLNLRRSGFATNKETIQTLAPVLKDLLPTFNYLKRNSTEIDYSAMKEKNDWLIALNSTLPQPFENFTSLLSNIPQSTPRWLTVEPQNWLDKILGLWPDGKPIDPPELDTGDKTVLSKSAQLQGIQIVELSGLNHREIVQTQAGQEKIMEILGLYPVSYSIPEAIEEPVLVFLIASPATIKLFDQNSNSVGEGDGRLMFIPNALEGTYQVEISGIDNGPYHLYLGQLTQNGDFWSEISGQISQGEIQTRQINFQPASPLSNPFFDPNGEISSQSARQKILELKEYINSQIPSPKTKRSLLTQIDSVLRLLDKNKIEQAISHLYELHLSVSRLEKKGNLPQATARTIKNKIEEIIGKLEEVYVKTNSLPYPQKKLTAEIKIAEKLFEKMKRKLKNYPNATPEDGALYLLAQEKLNKAKSSVSHQAHINALGVKYLSLEGLILFSKK